MAVASAAPDNVIAPNPDEAAGLGALDQRLIELLRNRQQPRLVGPDGAAIPIPPSAFHALKLAVEAMASGRTITLVPHGKELTTQEAADLLHVSRPYLIDKLLDTGQIPHHRVGQYRRLKIEDVLAYREQRARERAEALDSLTRMSQEVKGGYR
jgi:excisionase family DNA binding protein